MTTASSSAWRETIQHVTRRRLGDAVLGLLARVTGQVHVLDRVAGTGNVRMSYWVSRARENSPGRVRQECVLEALEPLQRPDQVVWQVTLMPLAERGQPEVVGHATWQPDAPAADAYRFRVLPRSDSAFGRPTPEQVVAMRARQSGHTERQTRQMEELLEQQAFAALRATEDLEDVRFDDNEGRILGVGAMRVVLAHAHPTPVMPGRVRAFLQPFEHFHLLDVETRAAVYRVIGDMARTTTRGDLSVQVPVSISALLTERLPLTASAIETWLVDRLIEAGDFDEAARNDPEARASAVSALLLRANYDTRLGERLTYGIGCYNRAVLREDRQRRFGSVSSSPNPCREILLGEPQEDRLSRMAADARERREAQQDAEIMARLGRGLEAAGRGVQDLVDLVANDTTMRTALDEVDEQTRQEVLRHGWRDASIPSADLWPEFVPPAPSAQTVNEIRAGTPLVIDVVTGFLRAGAPGEPHQFVAQGPPDADSRVMAVGTNGSGLLMPLGDPTAGTRRSAEVRVEESSDDAPWTESETPPPERVRGIRANAVVVDDTQELDPEMMRAIAEQLTGLGITPEQLEAQASPTPGGVTRQAMADAARVVSTPRSQPAANSDDRARQRRRQSELANELKRVVSQMFDPNLDDSRMTGEEVLLAHLRYRLSVLLSVAPVGRLRRREALLDDQQLDVVFSDPRTGREVARVRMDDPDVLGAAVERIGSYEAGELVGTRAIDL